ncbi:MAG: YjbQ family protein [Magnetococcales bacterium]|nr:YjbQ family protein [Magnetococcales bacterium]
MRHAQTTITVRSYGIGLTEITQEVATWLHQQNVEMGQLTIFCCHTSASLTIQENADPDVQIDLVNFFNRLVPQGAEYFKHTAEGLDDMPAHVKGALTDVSITIPITDAKMVLGIWQGIYLFEHRSRPHTRKLVLHFIGE